MENEDAIIITLSRRKLRITGVVVVSLVLFFSTLAYAYGQVNMSATIAGWFETKQLDNENLSVTTNMNVFVNGRQYVRCTENDNLVRNDIDLAF